MANNSQFKESKILAWTFLGQNMPPATTNYLAVMSVMPADDGTGGTEVSSSFSGGRISTAGKFGAITALDADTQQIFNNAIVDFGNNTTSGNISVAGLCLYNAATPGNGDLLDSFAFTSPVPVAAGSDFYSAVNAINARML